MACIVVFGAELLGYLETGVRILLQEAKEVFALYEIDLAGVHSLGGQFVGLAGNRGAEPQHFSRFDNLKDERLAILALRESFICPAQSTKMPRGVWPSVNRTAPLG